MALRKTIKGIIGACLTPFDDNDRIDYRALEKEMDFLIGDCDAVTIAAVEAAEYTMLSREERKELLKIGTQMVDKRVPVILGCSSPSPREVIDLAEYAATIGGDAAPSLGRSTDDRGVDGILYPSRIGKSVAGRLLSQSRAGSRSAPGRVRKDQRDR
jgi:dihydrodipicolinate synthase/N-acetylneuraminate lyase